MRALLGAMMINVLWNKRSGPGGGTQRLHYLGFGGEIELTHAIKGVSSSGEIPPLRSSSYKCKR